MQRLASAATSRGGHPAPRQGPGDAEQGLVRMNCRRTAGALRLCRGRTGARRFADLLAGNCFDPPHLAPDPCARGLGEEGGWSSTSAHGQCAAAVLALALGPSAAGIKDYHWWSRRMSARWPKAAGERVQAIEWAARLHNEGADLLRQRSRVARGGFRDGAAPVHAGLRAASADLSMAGSPAAAAHAATPARSAARARCARAVPRHRSQPTSGARRAGPSRSRQVRIGGTCTAACGGRARWLVHPHPRPDPAARRWTGCAGRRGAVAHASVHADARGAADRRTSRLWLALPCGATRCATRACAMRRRRARPHNLRWASTACSPACAAAGESARAAAYAEAAAIADDDAPLRGDRRHGPAR